MNFNFTEITYPSADGKSTIYAEIYTPKNRTAKGVVQLAHGMIDYTARYKELAEYLCSEGYVFAGNHHLGHGKSVANDDDFGFFAERGGLEYVIADMYSMNKYLREEFPALPIVLLGHSMGSFLARLYAVEHPHTVRGVIIHGTGGKNPLVGMGLTLAGLIKLMRGSHYRSKMINALAFGSYNNRFPKEEGENAWLTRDLPTVAGRSEDRFTSFKFTVSGYMDLFRALDRSNRRAWYSAYPKDMPTLVISGDMDPVGDYGKGPDEVYRKLLRQGASHVKLKMYEGARHELFNETNRQEVFEYLGSWLGGVIK